MKLALTVIILFVVLIAGAGIFLATWDIPAPTKPAEVVIPNDRFPR
jgi:hypothetical protein